MLIGLYKITFIFDFHYKVIVLPIYPHTTLFMLYVVRNLALDQHPESEASSVSIQLAERGDFLTFPIKFSLLKSGTFAWRTRIVSKNGSIMLIIHF